MGKTIYSAEQQKLQELLRQARVNAGLTQVGLAKLLRRPQSFVAKIEAGERRLDIIELRQVCHALGLTLKGFVEDLEKSLKR